MARKVGFSALESRSARLRLKIRRRPYSGPSLARGIALMYRRNKTNGTWVLKVSDGHGAYWTKGFALADDFEDADGKTVLTFYQAQEQAKKLARGDDGNADTTPITVDGALNAYKTDLTARSANPYNAEWPRVHLTSALLSKPVALLASIELKTWRNGLLDVVAPSTVNRLCACLSAALEQAAQLDKRIQNRDAWDIGLAALPNAQEARNVILSDAKVREFVAAAYRARSPVRAADRHAGSHGRAPEPGRPAPRRGSARSSGAAEVDDAEVAPRAATGIAARRRPSAIRCRSPCSWRPG